MDPREEIVLTEKRPGSRFEVVTERIILYRTKVYDHETHSVRVVQDCYSEPVAYEQQRDWVRREMGTTEG